MEKKKFEMPSAFSILFIIIIIVAALTWIIPAGQYQMSTPIGGGRPSPIAGTYKSMHSIPQGIGAVLEAPIKGVYDGIQIELFILVIGGFLGVIMKSGAIDAGIARVTKKLKGREMLLIIVLMIIFGIGGTTYGMAEETLALCPVLIPIFLTAGYDTITTASVILLGTGAGIMTSTVNPFATGIASNFADIPVGQGILIRFVMFVVILGIAIWFVVHYAEKVKKDPTKSLLYSQLEEDRKHFLSLENGADQLPELTFRHKWGLIVFVLTFLFMIYAVIPFSDMGITTIPTLGWWFTELSTLFFVSAIVIGIVTGLKEKALVHGFLSGVKDLIPVMLIIAVSRGITIIMNAGNITATILHFGETTLSTLGQVPFSILTFIFYLPLSFLVPSTSGLATMSMPIMAPLATFANVPKDIVITAYTAAVAWINLVAPTSGLLMGILIMSRIPYGKWLKFIWKFLLITFIVVAIFVGAGSVGVLGG